VESSPLDDHTSDRAIYLLITDNIPGAEFYFFTFDTITITMTIATITRKKAHHMPALKIVSTAPQLLRTTILKSRINKALVMFIIKKFTVLPIISQLLYHF
jgi:hypothetical protein